MANGNPFFPQPLTPTAAQWQWNTTNYPPTVIAYNNGTTTKTGLQPIDLQNFIGIPLIFNTNPPQPLSDQQLLGIIRQAEDWVEQNSGILLSKAWIASPPVPASAIASTAIITTSNPVSGQVQGIDYDMYDSGYDFFYRRFLMEGWGIQQLRYRPLKNVYYMSFIYPLLSEFFQIPLSWIIQDNDAAFVRIVPAANVQMLPLFAMQLAFMGFAQSLPNAMYFQYVAGLDSLDYQSRYAFMLTLVLSEAAIIALGILQGTVNYGAIRQATSVDGLRYDVSYPNTGAAYGGLIMQFTNQRNELMTTAIDLVRGAPAFFSL
jgi:hypothetical protein